MRCFLSALVQNQIDARGVEKTRSGFWPFLGEAIEGRHVSAIPHQVKGALTATHGITDASCSCTLSPDNIGHGFSGSISAQRAGERRVDDSS